jgi:superfamily II DNA or RNA helicase
MDNKIRVRMLSHSYMAIESNPAQEQELRDYFSFFVPGYRYMPAFKRKQWDGKIKLYNMVTKQMNVGLYHHLRQFCADRFYPLEILEHEEYGIPNHRDDVDHPSLVKYLSGLDAPFEPRDYQYKAIAHGVENRRAILLSPTGSGKSFIIYNLMRYALKETNGSILIVVPTTSLVEQMYKDFEDYGYDVEDKVHRIYSGKEKITDKRIIVSTWQSIYKFGKEWFEQFETVFGDEVHLFKAKSLSTMMDKCINAKYRFGLTGTLDGTETNKLVLEGLFGPVFTVTSTVKLQKNKQLADLDISILLLKYHSDVCNKAKLESWTYQEEIDYIVTNKQRNKFITKLACDQKGNTLVMFQFVEKHGKILYDMICDEAKEDRKVFYVSGEVDASDREKIRRIVERENDAIIVASLGTFSTGINIRNLHNIIFGTPSKSQVKVLQSIGRGLRKSDDGSITRLYDISDDLSSNGHRNFTLNHSGERIKIYTKEGFRYKVYPINLKGTSLKETGIDNDLSSG